MDLGHAQHPPICGNVCSFRSPYMCKSNYVYNLFLYVFTCQPPPVFLAEKARRTRHRHVSQTSGRKSEKFEAVCVWLLKIFMNRDSGEPSDYLWNREIFVLQDCNTYLAIVVVPYYCDPGRYLGNNLQLGRQKLHKFSTNLFFSFSTSLNWNSSLRRQVSVNSSSLSPPS